jgi:predicted  nucleic acid-binding Zn-ribbon protein
MKDDTFEKLAQFIKELHDEMNEKFVEVHEQMVSLNTGTNARIDSLKVEVGELRKEMRTGFRDIRREVSLLREDITILKEKTVNYAGFSKELDYLLQRVHAIEKHLNISTPSLV